MPNENIYSEICSFEKKFKNNWNVRGNMASLQEIYFNILDNEIESKENPINDFSISNENIITSDSELSIRDLKTCDTSDTHCLIVGETIKNFLEEEGNLINGSKLYYLDMQEVYPDNTTKLNELIIEFKKKIIKELNPEFKYTQPNPDPTIYNYVYVAHRHDGMVVVVGKSSCNDAKTSSNIFSVSNSGDLFDSTDIASKKEIAGTINVILRNECGNDFINKLARYYKSAWVIGIPSSVEAKDVEKSLGDHLINEKVPILNYYSHRINN